VINIKITVFWNVMICTRNVVEGLNCSGYKWLAQRWGGGGRYLKMLVPICHSRWYHISGDLSLKNAVLWDVAPCGIIINRCFGGMCCLHLQGRRNSARKSVRR
jgi:hypothetical protein